MFANVFKANPYRDDEGRYTSKDKAVHTTTMDEDMQAQMKYLKDRAQRAGSQDADQFFLDNPQLMEQYGKEWRKTHAFKGFAESVFKANPYHDEKGRFTTKDKGWKKVGHNLGSNPGGKYLHAGVKHYVKFPNSPGQVAAEEAADAIYEMMGVNTLKHRAQTVGDKVGSVNVWQDVQEFGRDGWRNLTDEQKQAAANAFVASALTKNWDVVGLSHDNMGLSPDGKVTIFDTGGSFKYRAMGGPKDFGADPMPELLGMLDVTKTSGRVFAPLLRANRALFERAAKKLKSISDRDLRATVRNMGDDTIPNNIVARKKAIMRFFGVR